VQIGWERFQLEVAGRSPASSTLNLKNASSCVAWPCGPRRARPRVHGVLARRWEAGGPGWWVRDSFVVRFCDCVASRIHRPAAFCVLFNPLVFNSCTD